uniref:Probable pectin methyltransferase QUA2 n=1 Tax=Tanacetum cinerariifolium TaxID=118510 RepID=A0A6L2PBS4_TANCI|nr:probable pectin methyltransferase QUA2 [Tanacetum cinerariifolium]
MDQKKKMQGDKKPTAANSALLDPKKIGGGTAAKSASNQTDAHRYRLRSLQAWAGQTDARRAPLWHAVLDTQRRENHDLRMQLAEERRERLELADRVARMERRQERMSRPLHRGFSGGGRLSGNIQDFLEDSQMKVKSEKMILIRTDYPLINYLHGIRFRSFWWTLSLTTSTRGHHTFRGYGRLQEQLVSDLWDIGELSVGGAKVKESEFCCLEQILDRTLMFFNINLTW